MDILRREYSDLRIFRARDILSYGHSDLRTVYSYGHFELLSAVHRMYILKKKYLVGRAYIFFATDIYSLGNLVPPFL
jgi:hypothetical protein